MFILACAARITWMCFGGRTFGQIQTLRNAMGKVSTARWQKTRWMVITVPNEALAHQAGVDVETITDMWFNACSWIGRKSVKMVWLG